LDLPELPKNREEKIGRVPGMFEDVQSDSEGFQSHRNGPENVSEYRDIK
jgi:hypothetical protein